MTTEENQKSGEPSRRRDGSSGGNAADFPGLADIKVNKTNRKQPATNPFAKLQSSDRKTGETKTDRDVTDR